MPQASPEAGGNRDRAHESIIALAGRDRSEIRAVLTRLMGWHNEDLVDDVVQEAFSEALACWPAEGIPKNPRAWLIQVAKRRAIDLIRKEKNARKFSDDLHFVLTSEWSLAQTVESEFNEPQIRDDTLRMIFLCCRGTIKAEHRLPFVLRHLFGLSTHAISRALLIGEENLKKRLARTKSRLAALPFALPETKQLPSALDSVHTTLYLVFNEGYYSSRSDCAMDVLLCHDALGLIQLLAEHHELANRDTAALLALMLCLMARRDARLDEEGNAIALDCQDRSLWYAKDIECAGVWLKKAESMPAGASGRFYWEAKIAWTHLNAANFEATDWSTIERYYQQLVGLTASPVAMLNHAIAIAYSGGLETAIFYVEKVSENASLKGSHMPAAILAHLYAKAGKFTDAKRLAREAQAIGGTPHEHQLMWRQLERLETDASNSLASDCP